MFRTLTLPLFLLLTACGTASVNPSPPARARVEPIRPAAENRNDMTPALMAQYRDWRSVKYKEGGLSKSGVDCSGFVYRTYLDRFGIRLPRSTELLAKNGAVIPAARLLPGDLVFFKTGVKQRHVGIYVGDRNFIHASTSRGVTISSLDNVYWSRNYWKSIRVVD